MSVELDRGRPAEKITPACSLATHPSIGRAPKAPAKGWRRLAQGAVPLASPLVLIGVWELIAVSVNNPFILPRVESVWAVLSNPLGDVLGQGALLYNIFLSALRVVLGFSIAALVGVPVGLLMGAYRLPYRLFNSSIEMFRTICPIAFIPFAMAVFRLYTVPNLFGVRYSNTFLDEILLGMIFVLFWGAVFPIVINTISGVHGVRKLYIETAQTLGARGSRVFWKVIFPASLPSILTGLRVGAGVAWMVVIAAEMLPGSDSGIGYLIIYGYQLARMEVLIASMICIGVVGFALNKGLYALSVAVSRWQAKER